MQNDTDVPCMNLYLLYNKLMMMSLNIRLFLYNFVEVFIVLYIYMLLVVFLFDKHKNHIRIHSRIHNPKKTDVNIYIFV